jgi:hypothetical protein
MTTIKKINYGGYIGLNGWRDTGDAEWDNCVLALQYWTGDAIGTDKSPQNNTVTGNGTAALSTLVTKFAPQSVLLDGNSDYLSFSDADTVWESRVEAPFTYHGWFYTTDITSANRILHGSSSGGTTSTSLEITASTGAVRFQNTGGTAVDISSTNVVSTSTWHHIAVVYDGATVYLFLDGALENSATSVTITQSTWTDFNLGRDGVNTNSYLVGNIGEVYFHTRALWTAAFTAPTRARPLRKLPSGVFG